MTRPLAVPAWNVREGDVTSGGARVVSVIRDPSAGRVLLGLSSGGTAYLSGEQMVALAERLDEPARKSRVAALWTAATHIGRRP